MYVLCFLYIFFILISLHFWRASLLPTSQDHHLTTIITWKPGRLSIMTLDSEPPRFQLLNSIHTTMYVFCFLYIFFILISLHFWRASLLPTSQDHHLTTIITWKPGRLSIMTLDSEPPRFQLRNTIQYTLGSTHSKTCTSTLVHECSLWSYSWTNPPMLQLLRITN